MPAHAKSQPRRRKADATRKRSPRRIHLSPAAPTVLPVATAAARSPLHEIERIVLEFAGDSAAAHEASGRAHKRALALTVSARPRVLSERVARIVFAADLVAAVAPELAHQHDSLVALIDRLETSAKMPRLPLGREVLRAPQLLRLPPSLAVDVALALVLVFTKARAAALWVRDPDGKLMMLAGTGELQAMPEEWQDVAGKTIAGDIVIARDDGALAVAQIKHGQSSPAALVVFGDDVLSPDRRLLLEAAEPLLTLALERHRVTPTGSPGESWNLGQGQNASHQHDALAAATKRLTRLRFDLHDGPQQDVLMLADDLRQFRQRLQETLRGHRAQERLLGGIDDLEARLVALDGDLRRLSASVQSPFLQPAALPNAVSQIADAFAARSGITPSLEMTGDLTGLTDSQQITVLALIREALSNIREHSEARNVSVVIQSDDSGLTASVTDDGQGFDPETALVKAAREGHLGLVGMHERVRMLGGCTQIDSRPGGPTVISVSLPVVVGAPRQDDPRGNGSSRGTRRA